VRSVTPFIRHVYALRHLELVTAIAQKLRVGNNPRAYAQACFDLFIAREAVHEARKELAHHGYLWAIMDPL
jgi:hypothetical protein